jgi:hypothetical protein
VAEAEGSNVDGNYFPRHLTPRRWRRTSKIRHRRQPSGPRRDADPRQRLVRGGDHDGTTWRLYLNGVLETTLVVGRVAPRFDSIQHAGRARSPRPARRPASWAR